MKKMLGIAASCAGLVGVTLATDAGAVYMVHSGMLCVPENSGPYGYNSDIGYASSWGASNVTQTVPLRISCPIPRNNMAYRLQEIRVWADNNNNTDSLTCKAYLFDEWGLAAWQSSTATVPHNQRVAITWTVAAPYNYYNYHFYSVDCTLPPAEGLWLYNRSAILGYTMEEQP